MTRQQTRTRTPQRKSYRKSRASRGKGSARKTKPKQKSHKKKQSLRHGFHRMLLGGMNADEAEKKMIAIRQSYTNLEPIYRNIWLKFQALGKVEASKVAEAERVAKVVDKTAVDAINNALDALRVLKTATAPGQGPAQKAEAAVGSADLAVQKFKKAIEAVNAEVEKFTKARAGARERARAGKGAAGPANDSTGAGAAVSLLSGYVADGSSDGLTRGQEWSVPARARAGVSLLSGYVADGTSDGLTRPQEWSVYGAGAGARAGGVPAATGASPIPNSSYEVSTSPSSSAVPATLNSSSIINTVPAISSLSGYGANGASDGSTTSQQWLGSVAGSRGVPVVTSPPVGKGALESVTKAKSPTIVSSIPVTQDQILKKQIGDAEADVTSDGFTAVPAGKIYSVTGTQLMMGLGAAGLLGYNVLHHKSKTQNTAK